MKIKEVAQKVGMNNNTVRYYTDQGLVPGVTRYANGYRFFNTKSIDWLKNDKQMREAGMSIRELKYYVRLCLKGHSTMEERCKILNGVIKKANLKLIKAKQRVNYLNQKSNLYQQAIKNKRNSDLWNPQSW